MCVVHLRNYNMFKFDIKLLSLLNLKWKIVSNNGVCMFIEWNYTSKNKSYTMIFKWPLKKKSHIRIWHFDKYNIRVQQANFQAIGNQWFFFNVPKYNNLRSSLEWWSYLHLQICTIWMKRQLFIQNIMVPSKNFGNVFGDFIQ